MSLFFQQIFSLLTSPPGNLVYHLVLVFAITSALQSAYQSSSSSHLSYAHRLVGGLIVLLVLQLALFAAAAASWIGLVDAHTLLPPLDRLIYLFSTLLIIWLWLFPEPRRMGDIALLLLALFVVTGFALSLVWWSGQQVTTTFNGTWPDQTTHIFAGLLLLASMLAIALQRPSGWGMGLAVFGLLFIGHILGLLVDPYEQDYSGSLRLAQIASFPWLLALSLRITPQTSRPTSQPIDVPERRRLNADPGVLRDFFELATVQDAERFFQVLSQVVARMMVADLCMLVNPPEPNGQLVFPMGFNLIEEKALGGFSIETRQAPEIARLMQQGGTLRLPATSPLADMNIIARYLQLNRQAPSMIVPVSGSDGKPIVGLMVLSPYFNRTWSPEDQNILEKLAEFVAHRIAQLQSAVAEKKPSVAPEQLQQAQNYVARLQEDNNRLLAQIDDAQRMLSQEKSRVESLAALVARQEELNNRPQTVIPVEPTVTLVKYHSLEEALNQARQKVSELENQLATVQHSSPAASPNDVSVQLSVDQGSDVLALIHELRQPLTSIAGYTDMLLGESLGILGTLQRKFLERIKASIERMTGLADDLIQLAGMNWGSAKLKIEPIDLNVIIDDAIEGAMAPLREKNLVLRVDVPDNLPVLHADRGAIQHVLTYLLKNAGVCTPPEGEVSLSARAEIKEHEPSYILIQVSDSGEGIPADELTRIFSRIYMESHDKIQGLGVSGDKLAEVKMLVEAHGGRIWVDSTPEQGSTFSALLPLVDEELGVR